jgi:hypothetical protein
VFINGKYYNYWGNARGLENDSEQERLWDYAQRDGATERQEKRRLPDKWTDRLPQFEIPKIIHNRERYERFERAFRRQEECIAANLL